MMFVLGLFIICILGRFTAYAETYEYDNLDRVTKVTYEDGSCVTYEYDASGNMTDTSVYEPETKDEEESIGDRIVAVIQETVEKIVNQVVEKISNLLRWIFG